MLSAKERNLLVNWVGSTGFLVLAVITSVAALVAALSSDFFCTMTLTCNAVYRIVYAGSPASGYMSASLLVSVLYFLGPLNGFFSRHCSKHATIMNVTVARCMFGLLASFCGMLILRTLEYAFGDHKGSLYDGSLILEAGMKLRANTTGSAARFNESADSSPIAYSSHDQDLLRENLITMRKLAESMPPRLHQLVLSLYMLVASIFLVESILASMFWKRLAPYGKETAVVEDKAALNAFETGGEKSETATVKFIDTRSGSCWECFSWTHLPPAGGQCVECNMGCTGIVLGYLFKAIVACHLLMDIYHLVKMF
ncbi:uncharacterized protein LOC129600362 [Paramacrobiotus metropolitanus]|uniref:uncharacterized protein LOC129600362 n=1 Tax=Paramacrobiotus metropolitanus TaxID=2943436 RepID=UPI002445FD40|nr:uncharacterized protein LOC129600362 [Paramacrobiotus metropolitanus]XP_055354824.1 uncharacterized protein LOC129600362 [Paramacrobiotus metropolitanus]XP_055354825.1 uncharacterized protein LOC129600362 [Paramacrobiotus metropolitanus]